MNRFFSVLLAVPLFFVLVCFVGAHLVLRAEYNEFEEYRLEVTNNYCTDAAVGEILSSDDLDQDYTTGDKVTVNPDIARDTYLSVLALSYDQAITRESLKMLSSQYLDLMVVVGYDGYYVYENTGYVDKDDYDGKKYDPKATPKLPFTYVDGVGTMYTFDLGFEEALMLKDNGIERVPLPINKSQALTILNTRINDEINYRLGNRSLGMVNIPIETTTVGTVNNNIEDVSVIALINNVNLTTSHRINAFSIGGARINQTRMVACYKRGGKPYYCYVDLIPDSVPGINKAKPYEWADHVVTSIDEAASLGYSPDIEFLERSAS